MADRPSNPLRWIIAGALGGIVLGSMGIAFAQTDEPTTTTTAPSSSSSAPSPSSSAPAPAAPGAPSPDASGAPRESRPRKAELTGEAAEKVEAAALAAVPGGTVDHMHEGRDGGYVAIVTKSDGTRVAVKLDGSFNVTSVEEGGACHHGRGGPGRAPAVTGEAAERATAAATAAVPGATVNRVVEGRDGGYVALVTKSDGTRAAVKMDDAFNVTSVEDKVGRRGGRGPRQAPAPADGDTQQQDGGAATPTNV